MSVRTLFALVLLIVVLIACRVGVRGAVNWSDGFLSIGVRHASIDAWYNTVVMLGR
jgi:hypothetical protein